MKKSNAIIKTDLAENWEKAKNLGNQKPPETVEAHIKPEKCFGEKALPTEKQDERKASDKGRCHQMQNRNETENLFERNVRLDDRVCKKIANQNRKGGGRDAFKKGVEHCPAPDW